MSRDGKNAYASSQDEAMWEALWEVAARCCISRNAIKKWLGCSPSTLARCRTPEYRHELETNVKQLTVALSRALANGYEGKDEHALLDELFEKYIDYV